MVPVELKCTVVETSHCASEEDVVLVCALTLGRSLS